MPFNSAKYIHIVIWPISRTFSSCKTETWGTSQVVQWLRLHARNTGGASLIPDQGTRSHLLQLMCSYDFRALEPTKLPHTATNNVDISALNMYCDHCSRSLYVHFSLSYLFYFQCSFSTHRTVTVAMKWKDTCSMEAKLWRARQRIKKSRGIILSAKVYTVKAMAFLVVMYRWESWAIKKAERWRIDASELWC